MVATFFPDISNYLLSHPFFMFILPSTIACCPVLDEWSNFRPPLYLAGEVFLLRKRLLLIVTRPLTRPINLYAFASTYLSSSYLTSSGAAHGPKFEPFIPTIIIQEKNHQAKREVLEKLRGKKGHTRIRVC